MKIRVSLVQPQSSAPNLKELNLKAITFKNKLNSEQVICENIRAVEVIDGIEYLVVHRKENNRMFLMRKDVLEKINTTVDKAK